MNINIYIGFEDEEGDALCFPCAVKAASADRGVELVVNDEPLGCELCEIKLQERLKEQVRKQNIAVGLIPHNPNQDTHGGKRPDGGVVLLNPERKIRLCDPDTDLGETV